MWRTAFTLAVLSALSIAVAPAIASATTATDDAQSVFRTINRERAVHALPALHWNSLLTSAAHAHNLLMARYDTLSHQLSGERTLGNRVTAVGYAWRALGENVGQTSDCSLAGVLNVERMMYREVAPNDAHRRNILSRAFRAVGVDVVMDTKHHKAWLTEVFAAPA
jgi:uncharacterized protein YkwD